MYRPKSSDKKCRSALDAESSSLVLTIMSIILASLMVFSFGCEKKEEKEIKIGAILPLTGDAAEWGNNTKNGIDLAVEKVNNAGGINGRKLKILYEDTQGTPKNGVAAIQKLITIEKVPAVIDDSMSTVTLAMSPIAEKSKVVLLATGATAPKISEAGDYIFRIWNSDDLEGKVSAKFVYDDLKLYNAAILYINNDYGNGLESVFKKAFEKLGGRIISSESFGQGDTDFRTQLTKIKNGKPEAIYVVGYPKEIALLLKQATELKINSKVIGTVTIEDPNIIKLANKAAEDIIYPYPVVPDKTDSIVRQFNEQYKIKFGKETGITSDVGFDAVNMIVEAIRLGNGMKGEDIQKGLMLIKEFHGASGVMTFDENGDVNKPIGMKTIRKGNFEWYRQ